MNTPFLYECLLDVGRVSDELLDRLIFGQTKGVLYFNFEPVCRPTCVLFAIQR